jgi:hypothetical protein
MIAFFLWGFIVESPDQEVYSSKQFQVNDSAREERALNSRKARKKEAASVALKERDGGIALVSSPFRCGVTFSQQNEVAKLQALRSFEEWRSANSDYSTQLTHLQMAIDNRLELAKLWQVSDRTDPIFREI